MAIEAADILYNKKKKKDNDILTQFPMKTLFDVEEIERKLTTDENFLKQMVILIFCIIVIFYN
jgi:hypothetical protein